LKISLEDYLGRLARFAGSDYGNVIRRTFRDIRGSSELAMLAAPTSEELDQLSKGVAIMTKEEKASTDRLTDEQIQRIAADAGIDVGTFAIFINGYVLHCKRVS
jgi:signal recognition particle GTPase